MSPDTPITPAQAAESLLGWWAMAGVDTCLEDTAHDQLAAKAPVLSMTPTAGIPENAPRLSATQNHHAPPGTPTVTVATASIADAEHAAKAAQTIEELEAAIRTFDGCTLKASAATTVIARGNWAAKLMIIGEAPGADEDRTGQPFVGRAGHMLDTLLSAAGFSAEAALMTNVCFWHPPHNRKPSVAELAVCAPFVARAITLMQPAVIVLLGGSATQGLLGLDTGILSLRGRWHTWTSPDGALTVPVMPTLHPSYVLRQPLATKKIWMDLLAATARVDHGAS